MQSAEESRSTKRGNRAGRSDPKERNLSGQGIDRDGQPRWLKLLNRDPNREYAFAYKAGTDTESVSYFESLGYVIERWSAEEDGLRLAAGRTSHHKGEPIEYRGHVLMSIEREELERIRKFGPDGNTGSQLTDIMERKVRLRTMHREAFKAKPQARTFAFEDRKETEALTGSDEGSDG